MVVRCIFWSTDLLISCTVGICDARLHRRVMASFRGADWQAKLDAEWTERRD